MSEFTEAVEAFCKAEEESTSYNRGEYIDPYWRKVFSPTYSGELRNHPNDTWGKWLIFINNTEEEVLKHWERIKERTLEGSLGPASKIRNPELGRETLVICVYTQDCWDVEDVMRVRGELRNLGYTQTLSYKPNYETLAGGTGPKTVLYRSR